MTENKYSRPWTTREDERRMRHRMNDVARISLLPHNYADTYL